jgi:hypothetical protein
MLAHRLARATGESAHPGALVNGALIALQRNT